MICSCLLNLQILVSKINALVTILCPIHTSATRSTPVVANSPDSQI